MTKTNIDTIPATINVTAIRADATPIYAQCATYADAADRVAAWMSDPIWTLNTTRDGGIVAVFASDGVGAPMQYAADEFVANYQRGATPWSDRNARTYLGGSER